MDTSIDFSHTADTGDNKRVFLASPQVALCHISSVGLEVEDKLKELDSIPLIWLNVLVSYVHCNQYEVCGLYCEQQRNS